MGVAFLPAYVKALGVESYGLVGIYTVMQAWLSMFDLGLTPTLNREMARLRAGLHTPNSIRDLLRSIEVIFALVASSLIIVVWFGAAPIADHWLKTRHISRETVIAALQIIGFVLASRWLEQIYRAALLGMQDQVAMNLIQSGAATLRWGGAYVIVSFVRPSILAFFVWQGISSLVTTSLLAYRTYHVLPKAGRSGQLNLESLKGVKAFAFGMFLTSVTTFLLTQSDKIVISKLLPIDQLGYYTLASSAAGALLLIVTPLNNAIYPRLTELVALGDWAELERIYRLGCEIAATILVPVALVLAILSGPVLILWTGDAQLTETVAPILSLLALGTLLNGLMNVPYMGQLAHGWTSLSVVVNILAVFTLMPTMFVAVTRFGITGAASVWLLLNGVSLIISIELMYRRILVRAKSYWYLYAFFLPLIAGGGAGLVLAWAIPPVKTRMGAGAELLLCGPLIMIAVICTLPGVRKHLHQELRRRGWRMRPLFKS